MAKRTEKSIELSEPLLARAFGLERLFGHEENLALALEAEGELSEAERGLIKQVCIALTQNADSWNEEELKMRFISMIMFLAHFEDPVRSYYDREISETVEGRYMKCKADMLLAKGIGELIEAPYFFLHEYKREKRYSGDPIGQMLAGMLIGQAKNNNGKPIYGCYVQGRFWFFSVLVGKKYEIGHSLDATDEAVAERIVLILKKIHQIILTQLLKEGR